MPGGGGPRASEVFPATQAVLGNPSLDPAEWLSEHNEYAADARERQPSVVFLGDSNVFLWGDPRLRARPNLPGPVGRDSFARTFTPLGASAYGAIGDQTGSLIWRVYNGELASNPKVAVVMVGHNNLKRGDAPDQVAAGVAAVVSGIRVVSPRTKILVVGLLPSRTSPLDPVRVAAQQVNARLPVLLRGRATFVNVTGAFLNPDGTVRAGLLQPQEVHLTAAGYDVLTQALAPAVVRLMAAR